MMFSVLCLWRGSHVAIKKKAHCYVHVSLSDLAFSLSPHPSKTWRETRAQYCTVPRSKRSSWRKYEIVLITVHLCVGGKPLKMNVAVSLSFSLCNCENVTGRHEEQQEFWAFVCKNQPFLLGIALCIT